MRSCLEGSLSNTRLGSDEALLPFPDPPEATNNQQETIHDDITGRRESTRTKTPTPIGIVDANGVELAHESFPTSAAGYLEGSSC